MVGEEGGEVVKNNNRRGEMNAMEWEGNEESVQ